MRLEQKILTNLIHNEDFARKVAPFIIPEYFELRIEKVLVEEILQFFTKYNKIPTQDIIKIELGNRKDISDKDLTEGQRILDTLHPDRTDPTWLTQKTEKFCKDRAVYIAILESIKIIENQDKTRTQDSIPKILADALSVSFDQHIGHDYLIDAEQRFDFYHRVEEKMSFDLEMFNKITAGGFSRKTLNIILAGTGVGKSLAMCHMAAGWLKQGKNVLYITLEMAEERIAERIDANLMNITLDELKTIDRNTFDTKIGKIASKTQGKLVIKEYPTASAHSGHFRALIEELKQKRNFTADVIVIDYINICASARFKMGASVNSYFYVKSIAEDLRGLAIEYNVPVLSATQTNRGGFDNSDVGLTDTSESFGLPQTADWMVALMSSEELEELGQMMVKQLKNRYQDLTKYKRFVIGVEKAKMKLFDVEDTAQDDIAGSGQEREEIVEIVFKSKKLEPSNFDDFKY